MYLNRKKQRFCHTNQLQLLPLLPLLPIQAFPGLKAGELAIEQCNFITWSPPFIHPHILYLLTALVAFFIPTFLLHPHFTFCFIPTFCYMPQTNHVPSKLYLVTNWTPKKIIYEISFLYILLVICVSKRFS